MSEIFPYQKALITGASSGIGLAVAQKLTTYGVDLAVVARRQERLNELRKKLLTVNPDLRVEVVACDIGEEDARLQLFARLKELDFSPDLLINNAGLGDYGEFLNGDWQKIRQMLRVNMEALAHLTHTLASTMVESKRGCVVNISSLASLTPLPDMTTYAASKAFVTSFSEGLRLELEPFGVHVLSICPGPIHTEFGQVAARQSGEKAFIKKDQESLRISSDAAVETIIRAIEKNNPRSYPGIRVAIVGHLLELLPAFVQRFILQKMRTRTRQQSSA